jgi:atypical dual specificity phosphatase
MRPSQLLEFWATLEVIMETTIHDLVWSLEPGALCGMPMPFLKPERRLQGGGELGEFDDDLPILYAGGVRSVVCLLNIPRDRAVYESAGFQFFCEPIPDFAAPTRDQGRRILDFIDTAPQAVAVHCEGGIGRTGTILAAVLIRRGMEPEVAIAAVRKAEPAAIESRAQFHFLLNEVD